MTGPAALAQLLGVGLLWIGVHCVGMCGPLLIGLDIAGGTTTPRGRVGVARGVGRTLLYQLGKAFSYAILGAIAGVVGAGLEAVAERGGAVLAIGLGLVALGSAAGLSVQRLRGPAPVQIGGRRRPGLVARFFVAVQTLLVQHPHPLRPLWTGAVMAFLPCMISLWALGLAALTGSPLWGAAVMSALAVMTTPMLLLVSLLSSSFQAVPATAKRLLQRGLTAVAGVWLVLVGLAGFGVIAHQHLNVSIGDAHYMVMFF